MNVNRDDKAVRGDNTSPSNQLNEPTIGKPSETAEDALPLRVSAGFLPASAAVQDSITILPSDVLCGRSKHAYHHPGNSRFRQIVTESLDEYNKAEFKWGRSLIVERIIGMIRDDGGRFVKQNKGNDKHWYELSAAETKAKVSHAIRDALAARGRGQSKKSFRKRKLAPSSSADQGPKPPSASTSTSSLVGTSQASSSLQHAGALVARLPPQNVQSSAAATAAVALVGGHGFQQPPHALMGRHPPQHHQQMQLSHHLALGQHQRALSSMSAKPPAKRKSDEDDHDFLSYIDDVLGPVGEEHEVQVEAMPPAPDPDSSSSGDGEGIRI